MENNKIIVNIKISPNAKKNEIIKTSEGIKIKINAMPIDGKANKVLIEFLSKQFKIPKTFIKIINGETSKDKTIQFITSDESKTELIKSSLINK